MNVRLRTKSSVDRWLRVLDLAIVVPSLIFLGPLMVVRALIACFMAAPMIESVTRIGRNCRPFRQFYFGGTAPGTGLPGLFNVLLGDLSLTGPDAPTAAEFESMEKHDAVRFQVRPGVFSRYTLQKRLGIAYQSERETARQSVEQRNVGAAMGLLARAIAASMLVSGWRRRRPSRFEILEVPINNATMDEAVQWMTSRAASGISTLTAFVNTDCLNISCQNPQYRAVLRSADRVFADGIGVRIASRLRGIQLIDNVNGTDLLPRLCSSAQQRDLSIFFLGARPGVAARAAACMRNRIKGFRPAGAHHGYFAPDEEDDVIDRINASGADILVVAFGAPNQELWLARTAPRLRPTLRVGVGGCFDFHSGRISRAPLWMRESGMEWIWRLIQEPRRMWRRYLIGNAVFLYRTWRESRSWNETKQRLSDPRGAQRRQAFRLLWKRIAWIATIHGSLAVKRIADAIGSALLMIALSPVFALTALAIRLDSTGPVLYSQTRVGRHGRLFTLWKFRSMYVDAEQRRRDLEASNEMNGGVLFKMRKDPRITRIGRIIRKTSIDELPQLWNVFRGDMSLVGPRPPLPEEVDAYSVLDRRRLEAIPGITCLWQISGRSDVPFPEQVQLDVEYIESMTLWRDFLILLKTIPAVIGGRGAY